MANPQRGEIAITVGGKPYTLALDLNAMCELQALLSTADQIVTFDDVSRGLMRQNMVYVRAFFWACLRRYHKEIPLEGVSDLMWEAGGLKPFLDQINALMQMTQPDDGDAIALKDKQGRPTSAAPMPNGIGPRSTVKRAKSA